MVNVDEHPEPSFNTTPLAVSWENHPWDGASTTPGRMSRRAQLRARGPYRAAVPALLSDARVQLSPDTAAEAEDALVEIARFDAELSSALPSTGDTAQELAPLAAVLLRTESASSSQIEAITAGSKALALATIGESTGPNARLVATNVEAMESTFALSKAINNDNLKVAHAVLLRGQDALGPGQYRKQQVWIGGSAPTPHTATFVPPHHRRVPQAMADLMRFIERTDIPVLTHTALAHAQFETIHPFADGNGRMGRVLIHAMLHAAGSTHSLTIPVSAGLLSNTRAYFDALTAYRGGEPDPIVHQMARAAFRGVDNGRVLTGQIQEIYAAWQSSVRSRSGSSASRLLPELIGQPAVTTAWVARRLAVSTPAAQNAIARLVSAEVLTPASAAKRNRVWVAEQIVTALDAFAARAKRGQ